MGTLGYCRAVICIGNTAVCIPPRQGGGRTFAAFQAVAAPARRLPPNPALMSLTDFRTLGRSGLVVSPLALGTMTFGTPRWGSSPED